MRFSDLIQGNSLMSRWGLQTPAHLVRDKISQTAGVASCCVGGCKPPPILFGIKYPKQPVH